MLKIDTEYRKGVLFLRFIGKLDCEKKYMVEELLELVNKGGFKYVMFNFEKVYYVDEEVLSLLGNLSKDLILNNGKIFTCGYNNLIRLKIEKSDINNYALEMNNELGAFKLISM